jgi:rubrerythrin
LRSQQAVTEAIAVDEMRHMWWLADLMTKRGGKPVMQHKELEFKEEDIKQHAHEANRLGDRWN